MDSNERQVVIAMLIGNLNAPEVIEDSTLNYHIKSYSKRNPEHKIEWIKGNTAKTEKGYIAALYGDTIELVARRSDN